MGVLHLDTLVTKCGFFSTEHGRSGYGCDHPEQAERDEGGSCFGFSCPVAHTLDPSTEPLDRRAMLDAGFSEDELDGVNTDAGWMLEGEPTP